MVRAAQGTSAPSAAAQITTTTVLTTSTTITTVPTITTTTTTTTTVTTVTTRLGGPGKAGDNPETATVVVAEQVRAVLTAVCNSLAVTLSVEASAVCAVVKKEGEYDLVLDANSSATYVEIAQTDCKGGRHQRAEDLSAFDECIPLSVLEENAALYDFYDCRGSPTETEFCNNIDQIFSTTFTLWFRKDHCSGFTDKAAATTVCNCNDLKSNCNVGCACAALFDVVEVPPGVVPPLNPVAEQVRTIVAPDTPHFTFDIEDTPTALLEYFEQLDTEHCDDFVAAAADANTFDECVNIRYLTEISPLFKVQCAADAIENASKPFCDHVQQMFDYTLATWYEADNCDDYADKVAAAAVCDDPGARRSRRDPIDPEWREARRVSCACVATYKFAEEPEQVVPPLNVVGEQLRTIVAPDDRHFTFDIDNSPTSLPIYFQQLNTKHCVDFDAATADANTFNECVNIVYLIEVSALFKVQCAAEAVAEASKPFCANVQAIFDYTLARWYQTDNCNDYTNTDEAAAVCDNPGARRSRRNPIFPEWREARRVSCACVASFTFEEPEQIVPPLSVVGEQLRLLVTADCGAEATTDMCATVLDAAPFTLNADAFPATAYIPFLAKGCADGSAAVECTNIAFLTDSLTAFENLCVTPGRRRQALAESTEDFCVNFEDIFEGALALAYQRDQCADFADETAATAVCENPGARRNRRNPIFPEWREARRLSCACVATHTFAVPVPVLPPSTTTTITSTTTSITNTTTTTTTTTLTRLVETITYTGFVSDVQCSSKRSHNGSSSNLTPDNFIDPLTQPLEHTVYCLYEIDSCRESGYDILDEAGIVEDGKTTYYAKYRLSADMNAQMEQLLAATSIEKGFRAVVTGVADAADVNGRSGFVLSSGTVEMAADYDEAAARLAKDQAAADKLTVTQRSEVFAVDASVTPSASKKDLHTTVTVLVVAMTLLFTVGFAILLLRNTNDDAGFIRNNTRSTNATYTDEPFEVSVADLRRSTMERNAAKNVAPVQNQFDESNMMPPPVQNEWDQWKQPQGIEAPESVLLNPAHAHNEPGVQSYNPSSVAAAQESCEVYGAHINPPSQRAAPPAAAAAAPAHPPPICEDCEESLSTVHCADCAQSFCDECKGMIHPAGNPNAGHNIIGIEQHLAAGGQETPLMTEGGPQYKMVEPTTTMHYPETNADQCLPPATVVPMAAAPQLDSAPPAHGSAPPVPSSGGKHLLNRDVNHHGDIARDLAEKRLRSAGKFRYLLREKSDGSGVVLSYFGASKIAHSRIIEAGGTYTMDGKSLGTAGMSQSEAIAAGVESVSRRVGKPIFPVRDPSVGINLETAFVDMENGYVNTSWEVMAAALSELPVMERTEAEAQLATRGIDGGFLLRQKGDEGDKAAISCLSCGKYEHHIMTLVEEIGSAKWTHHSKARPETALLEAAYGILREKLVPNPQCLNANSSA
jgi:hypothetical protein